MENENQKTKKLFVRIVGVAAAVAVVFLGVTQMRPSTFLGGIGEVSTGSLASVRVVPNSSEQVKGHSFYIDVVLRAGSESPKDVKVVLNYDKNLVTAMYVDTIPASFAGIAQHYILNPGQIVITGTLPQGSVAEDQEIVIGKIYFRALQNLGNSALTFEKGESSITSYGASGNILGSFEDGKVTVTLQ